MPNFRLISLRQYRWRVQTGGNGADSKRLYLGRRNAKVNGIIFDIICVCVFDDITSVNVFCLCARICWFCSAPRRIASSPVGLNGWGILYWRQHNAPICYDTQGDIRARSRSFILNQTTDNFFLIYYTFC